MLVVQVYVRVKPGMEKAFMEATVQNAQSSIKEPGIARFDVCQQVDDPTSFLLTEVYRTEQDPAKHKETQHYLKWRDTVAEMMAEPRTGIKYSNVFPEDPGWG